jgi:excisionase family DNA binding protein
MAAQPRSKPRSKAKVIRPHSIENAALRLGISPRTVRAEVARGKLKASKIGARLLIFDEQLAEYKAALPPAHFKS